MKQGTVSITPIDPPNEVISGVPKKRIQQQWNI